MTDLAVYSALYGPYEWAKPAPDLGVPCVMYTDDPGLHAPGWEVRVVPDPIPGVGWADPVATAAMMRHKYWKCHPGVALPGVEVAVWLDASMTVVRPDFADLCEKALGGDDWVAVKHPWRVCIFDEATFSAHLSRYDPASLRAQAAFYRSIGHPERWGLFATGASVRRVNDLTTEVGEQWWWECTFRTHQDQVSLPVLFRLAEDRPDPLRWNTNMPWHEWWQLAEHGR